MKKPKLPQESPTSAEGYRKRLGNIAASKLALLFQDFIALAENQYHLPYTAITQLPSSIELDCLLEQVERYFEIGALEFSNLLNSITGNIRDQEYISDFFKFLIRLQTKTESISHLTVLYWNISGEILSLTEEIETNTVGGGQLVQAINERIHQINLLRNSLEETHEFRMLSVSDVATTADLPMEAGMVITAIDQALRNCSTLIEVEREAEQYIVQSADNRKKSARIQDLLRIANTWLYLNTDGKVWKGVIRVMRKLAAQQGYFTELQLRELNILLQNDQVLQFLSAENSQES